MFEKADGGTSLGTIVVGVLIALVIFCVIG